MTRDYVVGWQPNQATLWGVGFNLFRDHCLVRAAKKHTVAHPFKLICMFSGGI